ncbi:MAG: hypothetical protein ACRDZ3_00630 [Acidimicrobiia bacterium]
MEEAAEVRTRGRLARRVARSRRQRRMIAALLAVVGASATIAALTFRPAADSPASTRTAGSTAEEPAGSVTETGVPEAKPPSTAPGGVGTNPEKTGLPAVPAQGGEVRTGTAEEGCFDNVREYLEEWDRTGVEPDPCFTAQPASEQKQPDGVDRTYNGERF